MKANHTPGPWSFDGSGIVTAGPNPGCTYIADCRVGEKYRDEGSTVANARLISSAPELLDALQEMLEVSSCRSMSNCGGRGSVKSPASLPSYGKHKERKCDCCSCEAATRALEAIEKAIA